MNRVGGANGILLLSTAAFGIAGAVLSLTGVPLITPPKIKGSVIMAAGIAVICNLNAAGGLSERGFAVMCAVITAAFIVSIILYVAYYRMEEL